jgi:hypothetical protein
VRIRNFILADAVSPGHGKKIFIHGAGVAMITGPEFPYVHPRLGLFVTLIYESAEDDAVHRVRVLCKDEHDHEVAEVLTIETPVPPVAFEARDSFQLINVAGDIAGLAFETPGRYWIVLELDDHELDRMVLNVAEGPPGVQ